MQSFSSDLLGHVRNYYQSAKTNVTGGKQSASTPNLPDRLEPAEDASFDDEFGIESPVVNGGGALKPRPLQNGDLDSDEPIMTNGHGKAKKPSMCTLKTPHINPYFSLDFLTRSNPNL